MTQPLRTNNWQVAVSSLSFAQHPQLVQELTDLGVNVRLNQSGRVFNEAELCDFLCAGPVDALIIGTEVLSIPALECCPRLKLVAKYGVGLDNLDVNELSDRGIALGWTGGVNRRSVSELVLGFALGHFHNTIPSITRLRQGIWRKNGGRQLSNLTAGIVGFGHVGSDLARLLQAFGTKILCTDIIDKGSEAAGAGAEQVSYTELLKRSDLVSFHVPADSRTHGMFGPKEIATARPDALVVNTSRGSIVDFKAVCQAVIAGRLGAYAADVFPVEPCDLTPWAACETLYFTPHIGGNTREAVLAMGREAIRAISAACRP